MGIYYEMATKSKACAGCQSGINRENGIFITRERRAKEKTFYKDGKADGKSTSWFNNGSVSAEENYKSGLLNAK